MVPERRRAVVPGRPVSAERAEPEEPGGPQEEPAELAARSVRSWGPEGLNGLAGFVEARRGAGLPWRVASGVWVTQDRPGTFEYVRAATRGPYPQFVRIGGLRPMLRREPYERDCAEVTGRLHACHGSFPAT